FNGRFAALSTSLLLFALFKTDRTLLQRGLRPVRGECPKMSQECRKLSKKTKFLPATGWCIMRWRKQNLQFGQKSALAQVGAGKDVARAHDFSARKRTSARITPSATIVTFYRRTARNCGRNHLVTMCQFVSMFAKARCAHRKRLQIKALRQWLGLSE